MIIPVVRLDALQPPAVLYEGAPLVWTIKGAQATTYAEAQRLRRAARGERLQSPAAPADWRLVTRGRGAGYMLPPAAVQVYADGSVDLRPEVRFASEDEEQGPPTSDPSALPSTPIPPLDMQNQVVPLLASVLRRVEALEREVELLRSWRAFCEGAPPAPPAPDVDTAPQVS